MLTALTSLVPMLLAILLVAALAAAAWISIRLERTREDEIARHEKGLCPGCGYDVRASRNVCPECGRTLYSWPPYARGRGVLWAPRGLSGFAVAVVIVGTVVLFVLAVGWLRH